MRWVFFSQSLQCCSYFLCAAQTNICLVRMREREREGEPCPKIQSSCGQRQQNLPWPPLEPWLRLHQDRVWFHMFGLKLVKSQPYTRRLHGYHVRWSKITHTKKLAPDFLPHRHENRSCLSRRYFSLQYATMGSETIIIWKGKSLRHTVLYVYDLQNDKKKNYSATHYSVHNHNSIYNSGLKIQYLPDPTPSIFTYWINVSRLYCRWGFWLMPE